MLRTLCPFLLLVGHLLAGFDPNIRVDHQELPYYCWLPDVALWQTDTAPATVYVTFTRDSLYFAIRSDIMFQKSTNGGRTWLPEDVVLRIGVMKYALMPRILVAPDGVVYVVYKETTHEFYSNTWCIRSTDGGTTWLPRVQVDDIPYPDRTMTGGPRLAADSAGNLICNYMVYRDSSFLWAAASTDGGASWSQSVKVTHDILPRSEPDNHRLCVQPGTNHCYAIVKVFHDDHDSVETQYPYLYRSTDWGQSWNNIARLDTTF